MNSAEIDLLYVFRCAVYFAETHFAETAGPDGDLLKWWNWKGRIHANERSGATV